MVHSPQHPYYLAHTRSPREARALAETVEGVFQARDTNQVHCSVLGLLELAEDGSLFLVPGRGATLTTSEGTTLFFIRV